MSRGQFAWFLVSQGRFDESLREIGKAQTLDPLMPLFYAWSIALHNVARRFDESLEQFAKLQQIEPSFGLAYFHAGCAYYLTGRFTEAIETFEKGKTLVNFGEWDDGMLAMSYRRTGQLDKAAALASGVQPTAMQSPTARAWGQSMLGDRDAAFRCLDLAFEKRDTLMPFVRVYTELLAPDMARDPRFKDVLRRMNLQDPADGLGRPAMGVLS